MKSLLTFSKLVAVLLSQFLLAACPSPPPEEVREPLSREQYDSIMRAEMPPLRVRRSKEQLQEQEEEWE